ncbi:hypothetical protein Y1Q_0011326 [Alligator mississippiensis]|uniref:Uncharacterized protein n=1 Tax=Alligator mississippiensis TaxID=8496 RepID=A0A151N942_ALLMI|nr:hypothetical protein Y1Q_0011326 [Alligator mississippiensis]
MARYTGQTVWAATGRNQLFRDTRSNHVLMGGNVPMGTNVNTIVQKEETSLSSMQPMDSVQCKGIHLPKVSLPLDFTWPTRSGDLLQGLICLCMLSQKQLKKWKEIIGKSAILVVFLKICVTDSVMHLNLSM